MRSDPIGRGLRAGLRRRGLAVALVCAALAGAREAPCQVADDATRNAARDLAVQGRRAFDKGDYEQARDLLRRAYTLVPAPTIALFEARALVKTGRLVEAVEAYMRTVQTSLDSRSSEQFRTAVRNAETELLALKPRVPKLTVVATGPGAEDPRLVVLLDGVEMNRALLGVDASADPGEHVLTARAPGGEEVQYRVTLGERDAKRVELVVPAGVAPAAVPAEAPSRPASVTSRDESEPRSSSSLQTTLGFVALGVGGAGIATGIATGLVAASRHAEAEEQCPDRACVAGTKGSDSLDAFRALRTVSTVGYVVGGLGLAGGAALLWFAPGPGKTGAAASPRVWIGVASAGISGTL